ncbi:hypothetical protein ACFZAE_11570 [Streptomyces scabiei]|uniref:hypothetical protein n=1 Tax=Streptomyces scabiei TaxID=1930 RepID=UPI0036E64061
MRTAYLEGQSIAALAREHSVSRGAVRTAIAHLLPEHVADEVAPTPELLVTLDLPGKVARVAAERTLAGAPAEVRDVFRWLPMGAVTELSV